MSHNLLKVTQLVNNRAEIQSLCYFPSLKAPSNACCLPYESHCIFEPGFCPSAPAAPAHVPVTASVRMTLDSYLQQVFIKLQL